MMKTRHYPSPLSIPAGRSGKFAIQHTTFVPGIPVCLVSAREAFLTGRRPAQVMLKGPMRIHELVEFEGAGVERVWMSDEPQEVRQTYEWAHRARPRGRVLIGGLGLGLVAHVVAQLPGVTEVLVVERSEDVVKLVAGKSGFEVVVAEINAFVASCRAWPWDFCYLDTWQGTSEATWWSEVFPLRRTIANRFGRRRVACWAEDIMLGQVGRSIANCNRSRLEQVRHDLGEANVPHGRHWHYKDLPDEMSDPEIRAFTRDVGLPGWERRFGRGAEKTLASLPRAGLGLGQ